MKLFKIATAALAINECQACIGKDIIKAGADVNTHKIDVVVSPLTAGIAAIDVVVSGEDEIAPPK